MTHRFYGNGGSALRCIVETLAPAQVIRLATAYFSPSGFQVLYEALAGKRVRLLVGREEGGRDRVEEVILEFVENLAAQPMERRMRAMKMMLEALENNLLQVAVGGAFEAAPYLDARYLYQHAKLYIADQTAAVVTSANLSYHGLIDSREAGIRVLDPDDVSYFAETFDKFFEEAVSITEPLIEQLRAWVEIHLPFEVYVRALLELYGLPEEDIPPQLPALAGYQRPVVSAILQTIHDHNGAMLIASTGLGKTVMAAHVVAYLRMQEAISQVLVICPAGLKEMWRRYMRAAKTSSAEFSYTMLSSDDPNWSQNVRILEYELRNVDDRTLIILDESHNLRNEDAGRGQLRLRNQRIIEVVRNQNAKVLLMTATPFSTGLDDVNAQLRLLPQPTIQFRQTQLSLFNEPPSNWDVGNPSQLRELPVSVILTTPTVVQHFSHQDEAGERYVVFAHQEHRYFPRRLHIRTIFYENPFDSLLIELLDNKLLIQQDKKQSQHLSFFEDFELGKRAPFFEVMVMHQFCSSSAQVAAVLGKMEKAGGFDNMRFARQQELTEFVRHSKPFVEKHLHPQYDEKLRQLLAIIQVAQGEKVVVFCYYKETAASITQVINTFLPDTIAETTAYRDIDTVDNLLRRFAPVANEVPLEDRDEQQDVNVLVATGALAEGFNLQDASILINFDLPWTVLVLAQRMGRILRPWHTPREITIYNFVASTMSRHEIQTAFNWKKRLEERNSHHRSFADIPVISDSESNDGYQLASLAKTLGSSPTTELNLDEVLQFIEKTEQIQTSSFLDDLAVLSMNERLYIAQLPPGFRSVSASRGKSQLFLLLQYRRRAYPALFNEKGQIILNSEFRDRIMDIIRCDRSTPIVSPLLYDDDHLDLWIDQARDTWASLREIESRAVQVICALALLKTN